jgi:hypothetical protein
MYSIAQLVSMNNNKKYSSTAWIKNLNNIDYKDNNKLFNIYSTKNATLSGREYIAFPKDKILTENDYSKYNILK